MLSSCHIYKKFDMPQDTAMTKEYVQAKESGDYLGVCGLQVVLLHAHCG